MVGRSALAALANLKLSIEPNSSGTPSDGKDSTWRGHGVVSDQMECTQASHASIHARPAGLKSVKIKVIV